MELVRVAASTRAFLVSGWVFVIVLVASVAIDRMFDARVVDVLSVLVYPLGAFVWWFNRRNAVWIERDAAGVRVRARRWWKYEDLWSGRLRANGAVMQQYRSDVPIRFERGRRSWWRSEHALYIAEARFCIYPESAKLAEVLADDSGWVATTSAPVPLS